MRGWCLRALVVLGIASCGSDDVVPADAATQDCASLGQLCASAASTEVSPLLDMALVADCMAVAQASDERACRERLDCESECTPVAGPNAENRLVGCWQDAASARTLSFGPTNVHDYAWEDPPGGEVYANLYSVHGDNGRPDMMTLYGFMEENACYRVLVRDEEMFLSERRLIATDTCTQEADVSFSTGGTTTSSPSRWARVSVEACP